MNTLYSALTATLAIAFLTACGASKVVKTGDLGSRGAPPPIHGNYKMAECNRIQSSTMNIAGQISTYYSGGVLQETYLLVNLTKIPSEALSTNTHYLQIYRWSERVPGQPVHNSIPVRMYFVQKLTGMVSNPTGSERISKAEITTIINDQKLGNLDITLSNFFERHYIVLTGMELIWDAAKITFYNSSSAVASTDVLLPAFYANPNTYMAANPTPNLFTLHPNYEYRTSGATDNDYFNLTEEICRGFFGRIPASIEIETSFLQKLEAWFASMTRFLRNLVGL